MKETKLAYIQGFSMVELIIVILVMGIIGVTAFARYLDGSAFNAVTAKDAILTVANAAQQAALGHDNVTFEIDSSGGDWVMSAVAGGTVLRSVSISSDAVTLETGSAAASANNCANDFDTAVANDFELVYDRTGDLVEFTNNSVTEMVDSSFNGVRICVNDDVSFSVCVSPSGYAYEGDCDA